MAITVPTPSIQGAQQLGGLEAEAADTPVQNLTLPDLSFNSRMLAQVGEGAARLGQYLQEQEDERLLLELQAGLGAWERETLYGEMPDGTSDATGGILGLEGTAAFGVTERVGQSFDEQLAQFNESLSGLSARGRLAARQYAQSRRENMLDRATRFEFEQREAYNRQLRAQALADAQAAATTEWYSAEAMAGAEARLISSATTVAANAVVAGAEGTLSGVAEGSIPPWAADDLPTTVQEAEADRDQLVENMVRSELDNFRRRAIETAVIEGDVVRAREIFDQAFADRMPELREGARVGTGPQNTEWDRLLTIVTHAEARTVTMAVAGDLYSQFPNDRGAAIDEVRRRGYPGEAEYYIVEELSRRYSQAEQAESQQREQDYLELYEQAQAQEMNPNDPRIAFLPAEQQTRLYEMNDGLSVRFNTNSDIELRAIYDQGQEALAQVELLPTYLGLISREQYNYWAERISEAREAVRGDPSAWTGTRTELAATSAAITARLAVEDEAVQSDLFLLFEDEKQRRLAEGEPWNTRAINEYADQLGEQIPISRGIFGTTTAPLYQILLGTVEYSISVPGVPDEVVAEAARLLAEAGDPVTPENIQALYEEATRSP